jgi:hypothetical protein
MMNATMWDLSTKARKVQLLRDAGYPHVLYSSRTWEGLPRGVKVDVCYIYRRESYLASRSQAGISLLELLLGLSIAAGVSMQMLLTADLAEEAIIISQDENCAEALKMVHQFPSLNLTEKYNELCS